jgi:hypothetical protein
MDHATPARVDLTRWPANEVAIVTGGAQGIVLAVATRPAAEGARAAFVDVSAAGARAAAAALVADRRQAIGLACNVTTPPYNWYGGDYRRGLVVGGVRGVPNWQPG